MSRPLYQELAQLVSAMQNCREKASEDRSNWSDPRSAAAQTEHFARMALSHKDRISALVREKMPGGSGIDNGTKFDCEQSTSEKLVFHCDFQHMDSNGYYDGWTSHVVTVKASMVFGIEIKISGPDRNLRMMGGSVKDYIHDCFADALKGEGKG